MQENPGPNNNSNEPERNQEEITQAHRYATLKYHVYCDMIFLFFIRVLQLVFEIFMAVQTIKDQLYSQYIYKITFYWICYYIVSDLIQLGLLLGSFFACNKVLYSYAKFKFVATSIILILNFCMIIMGVVIVIKAPPNTTQESSMIKSLSILYIVQRTLLLLLISKMQFDLKRNVIPHLLQYQGLPLSQTRAKIEDDIDILLLQLPTISVDQLMNDKEIMDSECIICLEPIIAKTCDTISEQKPLVKLVCSLKGATIYHKDCLAHWIHMKAECPLCRDKELLTTHILASQIEKEKGPFELHQNDINIQLNSENQRNIESNNEFEIHSQIQNRSSEMREGIQHDISFYLRRQSTPSRNREFAGMNEN